VKSRYQELTTLCLGLSYNPVGGVFETSERKSVEDDSIEFHSSMRHACPNGTTIFGIAEGQSHQPFDDVRLKCKILFEGALFVVQVVF